MRDEDLQDQEGQEGVARQSGQLPRTVRRGNDYDEYVNLHHHVSLVKKGIESALSRALAYDERARASCPGPLTLSALFSALPVRYDCGSSVRTI